MQPWVTRLGPWFDLGDALDVGQRARLTAVRLATDGLWMSDAASIHSPSPGDRAALIEHLLNETNQGTTR